MDIETGECPSVSATKGMKYVSVEFNFVGYYLLML